MLRKVLAASQAPGPGWVVTMRVGSAPPTVEGEIDDAAGASVGRRALPRKSGECGAVARALGVWASLVLDSERQRAEEPTPVPPASSDPAGSRPGSNEAGDLTSAPAPSPQDPPWPAPTENEKPPPEADWYLHHEDAPALEIGAGAFLLTGTVGGALLGPTVFVVVEAGHGVFLRPSVAAGQTVTALPSSGRQSTWAASRFDTCLRLPGMYAHRKGMQLEACGGGDFGASWLASDPQQTVAYLAFGPSLDLRAELGPLAIVIRGVVGMNALRPSYTDDAGVSQQAPLWTGRLELGASWSLR